MCEGVLLWYIVKVLGFKVPTQYSWELIAERPFKLGCVECLVPTRAEAQKLPSSKKSNEKGVKQGPQFNEDDATLDAYACVCIS